MSRSSTWSTAGWGSSRHLWAHKREQAQPLRSPEREEWLLQHLLAQNDGPLTEAGVRSLQAALLELTRSELA